MSREPAKIVDVETHEHKDNWFEYSATVTREDGTSASSGAHSREKAVEEAAMISGNKSKWR